MTFLLTLSAQYVFAVAMVQPFARPVRRSFFF